MSSSNRHTRWPKLFNKATNDTDDDKPSPNLQAPHFWEPVWLRRTLLTGLSILFLVLLAVLVAISEVSKSRDGIQVSVSTHYIRTYAPTAVLILLSSAWRQIDFHCKQLTPWKVLHEGESTAQSSILLDYLAPLQVMSFVKASRNRHWAVACTVVGYALLKLLTVAATGLFTAVDRPLPPTDVSIQRVPFADGLDISLNDLRAIGPSVSFETFGVASQGLAERTGLTTSLLYETIDASGLQTATDYILQSRVRGLMPVFECQSAPFQVIFPPANTTDSNPETRVELLFSECTLRGGNGQGTAIYSLNPATTKVPPRQLSPLRQQIDCFNQTDENWQLLTLVDFRYNQTLGDDDLQASVGESVQASAWFTNISTAVGVACRSSYKMEEVDLVYSEIGADDSRIQAQRSSIVSDERLAALSDGDIGGIVDSALRAGASMAGSLLKGSYDEEYPNTLFKIMAGIANGTYDSLLGETAMIFAAQAAHQQLALQALDRHLRSTQPVVSSGTITFSEVRLKVNEVAAIVTLTGFVLLSVLSFALLWIAPRNATKQNPEVLASSAVILHDSPALQRILLRTKLSSVKLKESLKGFLFASGLGYSQLPRQRCGILVSKDGEASPLMSIDDSVHTSNADGSRWYRPATTKKKLVIPFLVLPLAIIGSLEAVQRVSNSNDGFVTVADPESALIQLLPQILSAFIMLCVAAAFSSIEFNVLMLAPIHLLLRRQDSPPEGLLLAYLGRLPPMVLIKSLTRKHWAVFLVTSSALIGSLLTLVASGLYTTRDLDGAVPLAVQQLDQLVVTWPGSAVTDSDAAVIQSLVESTDLGFPEFTYDELAFPKLQAETILVQNETQATLLETSLPALRASLNCSFLDASTYNFSTTFNARILTASAQVSASIPLPPDCLFGGAEGNETTLDFTSSITMTSNTSYIGKILNLHVGPYDPVRASPINELDPRRQPDNPATCPTLAFWYGHASLSNPSQTAASVLVCYQQLDLLNSTTTFTLPNMSISTLHPPVIDTSTTPIPILAPNTTSPNHPFRLQSHFDDTFASLDTFLTTTTTTTTTTVTTNNTRTCAFRNPRSESFNMTFDVSNPSLDPFFQGVLCASPARQTPLAVELLALTDAASRARVLEAVNAFYRRYMAVAVSKNMRVALRDGAGGEGDAAAVLIGPDGQAQGRVLNARKVVRLVQQGTVKVVLQGMLGVMVLCAGVGVWVCRLWRPVVQYDPCTVAGKMVLFAGTGVGEGWEGVWEGLDGAEVVSVERVRKVLRGWEWGLGWWDGVTGREGERERGRSGGGGGLVWGIRPVGKTVGMRRQRSRENAGGMEKLAGNVEKKSRIRVVGVEQGGSGWI